MNISINNERKVIDTLAESENLSLMGQAEFFSDHVYLHGRILAKDGHYIGQYNDKSVFILEESEICYMTEASQNIDSLIEYVSQL